MEPEIIETKDGTFLIHIDGNVYCYENAAWVLVPFKDSEVKAQVGGITKDPKDPSK